VATFLGSAQINLKIPSSAEGKIVFSHPAFLQRGGDKRKKALFRFVPCAEREREKKRRDTHTCSQQVNIIMFTK